MDTSARTLPLLGSVITHEPEHGCNASCAGVILFDDIQLLIKSYADILPELNA